MSVKISIIVPVYNVENYLEQCLTSLVEQTIEDKEIIVIDDCSSDGSINIINKYKNKYPKIIRVIENSSNQGVSEVRNLGISLARGKYIGFVDGDDFVSKYMYEIMYKFADEYDLDIVACRYKRDKFEIINDNYDFDNINDVYKSIDFSEKNNIESIRSILDGNMTGFCWDKIYRKSIFIENHIKFPKDRCYEDMTVAISVMSNSNRIININKELYYYRDRQSSAINNLTEKKLNDFCISVDEINKIINLMNKDLFKESIRSFNVKSINYKAYIYNNICKLDNKQFEYEFFNKISGYEKIKIREVIFKRNIELKEKIKFILVKMKIYNKLNI